MARAASYCSRLCHFIVPIPERFDERQRYSKGILTYSWQDQLCESVVRFQDRRSPAFFIENSS